MIVRKGKRVGLLAIVSALTLSFALQAFVVVSPVWAAPADDANLNDYTKRWTQGSWLRHCIASYSGGTVDGDGMMAYRWFGKRSNEPIGFLANPSGGEYDCNNGDHVKAALSDLGFDTGDPIKAFCAIGGHNKSNTAACDAGGSSWVFTQDSRNNADVVFGKYFSSPNRPAWTDPMTYALGMATLINGCKVSIGSEPVSGVESETRVFI